jgi:hypothetical protein
MRLAGTLIISMVVLARLAVAAPEPIVICQYNVENYLDAPPMRPGQKSVTRAKPEKQIEALIRVINQIQPDNLCVCEIG